MGTSIDTCARSVLLAAALAPALLAGCFPGPVKELWPPGPSQARYAVDVIYYDWHTLLTFPRKRDSDTTTGKPPTRSDPPYAEWGFAEKAWYLERKQGLSGVSRALFWPTESTVGYREREEPYWERYPDRHGERWTYYVSDEGLARMKAYLESEKGELIAEYPDWYHGEKDYCITYLCHHFILAALREAGLPVAPWWGYTAWLSKIQLDRIGQFHEEAGLSP